MHSGSHPWDTDRELTSEQASTAVVEHFPDLGGVEGALVGAGWDFDAYRFGEWAFLFPRRRDVAGRLALEARRSPVFAGLLADLDVAVPVYERLGGPTDAFPYPFVGYRWIEGIAADRVQGPTPDLAAQLGRVLTRLHESEAADVAGLSIPEDREGAREWFDEVIEYADTLRGIVGEDLQHCVTWLEEIEEMPAAHEGPLRLLHNDLFPDHILVDPNSGTMVGLIDFDDASFGDPMLDFVQLRIWRGAGFVSDVLDQYRVPLDSGFHERLEFMSRLGSLAGLYDDHLQAGEVDKHRRWVCTAFTDHP